MRVPSRTSSRVMHTLEIHGANVKCSCTGFYFRKRCWHVKNYLEHRQYLRQMRLQARMFGGEVLCS